MSRTIINGAYEFQYLPTGQRVLECAASMEHPNICLCGGFGSSKTRTLGEIALEFMLVYPGIRVGVFRKTRNAIVDTTYNDFVEDVLPPEYMTKDGWNKTKLQIFIRNWSRVQFFGIDNFNRKGSLKFDLILVDEAIELEMNDIVMLQGRLRGKVLPVQLIIYFTNAGAPGMPLYDLFVKNDELPVDQQDPDHKYFVASSFENIHNPASYFRRLEKWKGTPYYDRYVLAKWKSFEGVIYSMYEPDVHLITPFAIPSEWPKWIWVDFGYDHPMAILWVAKEPVLGQYFVYRQYYMTRKLVRDVVKEAKGVTGAANEELEEAIGDHDAENRAQFENDWPELSFVPAKKDVKSGIQDVMEMLLPFTPAKERGIYIFNDEWSERDGYWYGLMDTDVLLEQSEEPVCLQDEFGKYVWGKDDKPVKQRDHALDALRYGVHTLKYRSMRSTDVQVSGHKRWARR